MRRLLRVAAATALLGALAPAPGVAGAPDPPDLSDPAAPLLEPRSRAGAQAADVDVRDNEFVPARVEVAPGDTVTWRQSGLNPHSVTADDESFDSSPNCPGVCMRQGDSFEHTFERAGTFSYYCRSHGAPNGVGMAGTVVVRADVGAPDQEGAGEEREPAGGEDVGAGVSTPGTGLPGRALVAGGAAALALALAGALRLRRR